MSDFSTSAAINLELDQSSLRSVRDEVEDMGPVPVAVEAGDSRSDFSTGAAIDTDGGQNVDLAQLEKLNDIHETLEKIGVSTAGGGGGGGGGAGGFGGGLGDVGEAYFQFKTLEKLGGIAGGLSAASLSVAGGLTLGTASFALAAGTTLKVIADSFESGAWGSSTVVTDEFIADQLGIDEDRVADEEDVDQAEAGFNEFLDRRTVGRARRQRNYANRGGRGQAPGSTLPSATATAQKLSVVRVVPEGDRLMVTLKPSGGGKPITISYARLPPGLQSQAQEFLTSGGDGGGGGGGGGGGTATGTGSTMQDTLSQQFGESNTTTNPTFDIRNDISLDASSLDELERRLEKEVTQRVISDLERRFSEGSVGSAGAGSATPR